jgi:hypothetical protein
MARCKERMGKLPCNTQLLFRGAAPTCGDPCGTESYSSSDPVVKNLGQHSTKSVSQYRHIYIGLHSRPYMKPSLAIS